MLEKEMIQRIVSYDQSLTNEELDHVLHEIEMDAFGGDVTYLQVFLCVNYIYTVKYGTATNPKIHEINQSYVRNLPKHKEITVNQIAFLYIRNVEYYFSVNALSECARYACMIIDLKGADQTLQIGALSYLLSVLRNPLLQSEQKEYVELYKSYLSNENLTPDFKMMTYIGLFETYANLGDKEAYLSIRNDAVLISEKNQVDALNARFYLRLLICDSLFVKQKYNRDLVMELCRLAEEIPYDTNYFDSLSSISLEICKKLEEKVELMDIVHFLMILMDKCTIRMDHLNILEYLVDHLHADVNGYPFLYDKYVTELKYFRYTSERYSLLEIRHELIHYKRTMEKEKKNKLDELTGLYNRNAYEETVASYPKALDANMVAIMADVNDLKNINDTYGHAAGDELLRTLGACFLSVISKYGTGYRIGGDEFVAIVATDNALGLVEELKESVSKTVGPDGKAYSMSIGVAASRNLSDLDLSELIHVADQRMYKEKNKYHGR